MDTYIHTYVRGHGACQAWEGAAESGTPRGLNCARADPSFSMLDRVFPCTRLPQILRTRTLPLSGAASRFNVRRAWLNLAVLSFPCSTHFLCCRPPIPGNSATEDFISPHLSLFFHRDSDFPFCPLFLRVRFKLPNAFSASRNGVTFLPFVDRPFFPCNIEFRLNFPSVFSLESEGDQRVSIGCLSGCPT